jgi:ADP-ribose pyrophosphatase YjhB (NUDIX family)
MQPDHSEILRRVAAALGPDGRGSFCYVCGAPGVSPEETPEGEIFVCAAGHRSPRAFLFDGLARYSLEGDKLIHVAAGAVIRRMAGGEQQILLFLRQKYPYLYTIPAGHVEIGHDPADEMRREVAEETGLSVETATWLWPDEALRMDDGCRRGADEHDWYVYDVTATGQVSLSDEGRIIGWYRDAEIRELAAAGLLTLPTRAILARLGVIGGLV